MQTIETVSINGNDLVKYKFGGQRIILLEQVALVTGVTLTRIQNRVAYMLTQKRLDETESFVINNNDCNKYEIPCKGYHGRRILTAAGVEKFSNSFEDCFKAKEILLSAYFHVGLKEKEADEADEILELASTIIKGRNEVKSLRQELSDANRLIAGLREKIKSIKALIGGVEC